MHFIFIVNDIQLEKSNIDAFEISSLLLSKETWLYSPLTYNLKRIKPGDMVLLYLAGEGRRCFTASFEIAENIRENTLEINGEAKLLNDFYPLATKIKNINQFRKPVKITAVKEQLNFIKDKKNYGLFFRQATKLIEEEDFNFIISSAK